MKKMLVVESYNGGDQGFLNEMFAWWHRLPAQLNYLKVFVDRNDHLHWINKDVYAVHYTGLKPWKCFKERDCNWDVLEFHRYASNSAHRMWWRVYRTMPKKLRPYCSQDRYIVKNATSPKGHPVVNKGKINQFFESVTNFFGGGDHIPWSTPDVILSCEREVAEASKDESNDRTNENVQRGIAMLEDTINSQSCIVPFFAA
ncbi:hypothetical protein Pfo_028388 [Paulownia fortunei]|nr:hypothetical protein Pfo_028388 [Paulownia fortunei]